MKIVNIQPIEKLVKSDGQILDVHSIFFTIQGEGPFTGRRAVFIRLAGCNLQCPACDTEYTQGRYQASVTEVARVALASSRLGVEQPVEQFQLAMQAHVKPIVVITGGEPFRQNLYPLIRLLRTYGLEVQIETNGTLSPPEGLENIATGLTIVISPKAGKINVALENLINFKGRVRGAYKYVLGADSVAADGLPIKALDHSNNGKVARPRHPHLPIYLQPRDDHDEASNKANIKAVVQSCMKHGYIAQLQTHKYLEVE